MSSPLTYKSAGVDIQAGDDLVERIKPFAKKTMREGVLAGIGGFGAMFEIPSGYHQPVLVSGTDGVGTKLKLAFEWNMHADVGIDLVAMSVNDVLVQGAEPLYFLDYFACGKLDVETASTVIEGIAKGCEMAHCALIGGETAEMPDMYPVGEYDLAGFAVGVVEKSKILSGQMIEAHDRVLGLASSGVHSNGFSLVRRVIAKVLQSGESLPQSFDGKPFREALMAPTKIYVSALLQALKAHPIKGLAHITGGGLIENLPRILPAHLGAQLDRKRWPRTALFSWLQQHAQIDDTEMNRTFNDGIGMCVIVAAEHVPALKAFLEAAGETVYDIGAILPLNDSTAKDIQPDRVTLVA